MKNKVKITSEFGVIIRKKSLAEKNISLDKLKEAAENATPMSEDEELISYGPHFGPEAMDNFGKKLNEIGLEYIDDFFNFYGDFPDWAEFSVALKSKSCP
jgi:hypothetical protein